MLKIRIVSPRRVAWEGEASEIQVPGLAGEFGVLPDHARLLAATRAGLVTLYGASGGRLVVGPGFAEVGDGEISLLVDLCEEAGDVDKDAAARLLESSTTVLEAAEAGSAEWQEARRNADLATARLEA